MKSWVVLLVVLVAPGLCAQDRERIASVREREVRWDASVEGFLAPYGTDWWSTGISGRMGLEWNQLWATAVSVPYQWSRQPDQALSRAWGPLGLSTSWKEQVGEALWDLGLGAEVPWDRRDAKGRWYSAEVGAQMAHDPAVLGWSLGFSVNQPRTSSTAQGSLSLQEVINDTTSWALVLSPRLDRHRGHSLWSLSATWRVSWYQNAWGWSTGLGSGTGAPWSWSGSLDHHWDFP